MDQATHSIWRGSQTLDRRRLMRGATTSARTTPTASAASASGTIDKRRRLAPSHRTNSVSMTSSATSGSESRIASTIITMAHRRMVRQGKRASATATTSAAVPIAALRTASARRAATRTAPTTGTAFLASGSPGRLMCGDLFVPAQWQQLCRFLAHGHIRRHVRSRRKLTLRWAHPLVDRAKFV
jgi:hypothetical protein